MGLDRGNNSTMTYVADTHALVWLLEGNPLLSPLALQAFSDPSAEVVIPTIVLAEIQFLYTRQRIQVAAQQAIGYIRQTQNVRIHPLNEEIVMLLPATLRIHDAIIVATGLFYRDVLKQNTALLTQDSRIVNSGLIQTVW